jgi:hypothetical protein
MIAAGTMLTVGTSTVSCGYILHPERRGNRGGAIDGATMVMDLLWLLVGVIPGVVALIVDFSSGAIYVGGGHHGELRLSPDGHLALQVPHASRPGRVEFRLVNAAHEVVASRTALVGPGHARGETIDLAVAQRVSGPLTFEIATDDGQVARAPVAVN